MVGRPVSTCPRPLPRGRAPRGARDQGSPRGPRWSLAGTPRKASDPRLAQDLDGSVEPQGAAVEAGFRDRLPVAMAGAPATRRRPTGARLADWSRPQTGNDERASTGNHGRDGVPAGAAVKRDRVQGRAGERHHAGGEGVGVASRRWVQWPERASVQPDASPGYVHRRPRWLGPRPRTPRSTIQLPPPCGGIVTVAHQLGCRVANAAELPT
jgi:hypothetical protein